MNAFPIQHGLCHSMKAKIKPKGNRTNPKIIKIAPRITIPKMKVKGGPWTQN
jgi:hypothetical protein